MRIALLTDFGTRDPYVAAMKGVIAARTAAPVHDLTHEIAPFDVLEAAWFLKTIVPYWPEGTIFVCVVDPGVGTSRKIVVAESGGHTFLAPDNGLLTFVASQGRSIEDPSLFLPTTSTTFHGRDRFAPVAAALANGETVHGPRLDLIKLRYEPPVYGDEVVRGTIVAVDRFGNLITDIERARLRGAFTMRVRDLVIDRVEETYGNAAPGPFLIVGSSGHVEISLANASAADRLQLRRLERVELWPSENAVADY
jgi:S-adenosyl-L-methionine hydrolase (adenosine-forming)